VETSLGIPAALLGVAAVVGWLVAGPIGCTFGGAGALGGWFARRRRRAQGRAELLERQLADVAESVGLALRSGLSVMQALEFSRAEAIQPIRAHLDRFVDEHRLGMPFEVALRRFGHGLGTEDARFFVLITGIHARSGGDLAGGLDQVGETIRHRIAVRGELRVASAQGRLSGLIMGCLPVIFLLFLSVTSHDKLAPVLRSGPGMAMLATGLLLEAMAYLWIRRILRIEV
jgi:tight adherence protein B